MTEAQSKSVIVGMSGGVDSSVAAAYLLDAGYRVLGVTCLFAVGAAAEAAVLDARAVCQTLGIPHRILDARQLFDAQVIEPFLNEYAHDKTPSPCVGCNARCKVPSLLDLADELGYHYVATGHYVRIVHLENGRFAVKRGLDSQKDQSYMLSMLSQAQLARLVAPLGGTTKAMVRIEASERGLPVADRPESQDICFVEGDLVDYLAKHGFSEKPGPIVDAAGKVLGQHNGLFNYTIGQRHGIGIAAPEPYYVIDKDAAANALVVGFAAQSRIGAVVVEQMNWQAFTSLEEPLECSVRLRYRSLPVGCTVVPCAGGGVRVELVSPQAATAPGQFAVFTMGDTVLGGGTITRLERYDEEHS